MLKTVIAFSALVTCAEASAVQLLKVVERTSFPIHSAYDGDPYLAFTDRSYLYTIENDAWYHSGTFNIYNFKEPALNGVYPKWLGSMNLALAGDEQPREIASLVFFSDELASSAAFVQTSVKDDPDQPDRISRWEKARPDADPENYNQYEYYRFSNWTITELEAEDPSVSGKRFGLGASLIGAFFNEVHGEVLVAYAAGGIHFAVNKDGTTGRARVIGSAFTDYDEEEPEHDLQPRSYSTRDFVGLGSDQYAIFDHSVIHILDVSHLEKPRIKHQLELELHGWSQGIESMKRAGPYIYASDGFLIHVVDWSNGLILEVFDPEKGTQFDFYPVLRVDDTPFDGKHPIKGLYVFSESGFGFDIHVYQHVPKSSIDTTYPKLQLTAQAENVPGSEYWGGSRVFISSSTTFVQASVLPLEDYPSGYIWYDLSPIDEIRVPEASPSGLRIKVDNGGIILDWPGEATLQESNSPTGDFTDLPDATSPYRVAPSSLDTSRFWRLNPDN